MDKTRFWLSFDLGLHGNYEGLYEWLDEQDDRECGDSVASFLSDKTRDKLADEIREKVGEDPRARIYLIALHQGGKFILGKRKPAPWEGYSRVSIESEEER
jgi:hypothetical protein